jgi:hypothetical protein
MKPLTIKTGLALGGIAVGFGLERIPKINKIGVVKRFAQKSKDYGLISGKKIARSIVNDIDPKLADVISYEFSDMVNDFINETEERENSNKDIKVTFIDDDEEEDEIRLLPPHKENA